jgi:hypothetical protein
MRPTYTPAGVRLLYTPQYPEPPQEAFLWLQCLDAFYGGAAGPGKSSALLMAALQYADVPRYSAVIFRRTFADLNLPGALIPRSKEWLYPILGGSAWNEQRSRWTFPSGATLTFGYLQHADDHLRYQGAEFQFIGVDEASQIRDNQLRYLFSRLRGPSDPNDPLSRVPLRMRLASNPGDRSHEYLKRRYIHQSVDSDDPEDTPERARSRVFIRGRLQDNPHINQEAYVQSLLHLEPDVRAQLLEGDWDARQPGDWFFGQRHLAAVAERGKQLRQELLSGRLGAPYGGILPLGLDHGEHFHGLLLWPLDAGGYFVVHESVVFGGEPGDNAMSMLSLPNYGFPLGKARYDAAGVQSMRTFVKLARQSNPSLPPNWASKIAFSKWKGTTATFLRRLARRTYGEWYDANGISVPEGHKKAVRFESGPLPGHLAISPECPELLRQLPLLARDPENPSGAWLKSEDQHGPDALIAGVAPTAARWQPENRKATTPA